MAELLVIRHGQASFGADDYDRLTETGQAQSRLVGKALKAAGWIPDRIVTGTLTRQRETLAAMEIGAVDGEHPGFNEYDFHDLLSVRFGGQVPAPVMGERKTHFRTLRDTILDWQSGGLGGAKESWRQFTARVGEARAFATDTLARRVMVISSGGVIGQLVASALGAPDAQMIELNLQVRNTSMTRFMFSGPRFSLSEFNAAPHFHAPDAAHLMTYS